MAEIKRVFKESIPAVRLMGKKYANDDRDQFGGYGMKWQEWFSNGYFDALKGGGIEGLSDDFVGVFRFLNDQFEYWIGCLMSLEDEVPEGYEFVDMPAGEIAVCYVYGKEDSGELYGVEVHQECLSEWEKQGWLVSDDSWFMERYNCPRFTTPDEAGNIILDYCVFLPEINN